MTTPVPGAVRPVPPLSAARRDAPPEAVTRRFANGLTAVAVRRRAVPLVEVRLRIEFGQADPNRTALLTGTLLSGTTGTSGAGLAARLRRVGGALSATADADALLVSGAALGSGLERLLAVLAEVVADAAYPDAEVVPQRERLAAQTLVTRSRQSYAALTALNRVVYAGHPYAAQTPEPDRISAVTPDLLRELHRERIRPSGATLLIVGDVDTGRVLDAAQSALGGWTGPADGLEVPPVPPTPPHPNPLVLTDRPRAVQSSLRLALPAVGRDDPEHPALHLANIVFGGYFCSRLVENLREDKGYAYTPRSVLVHMRAGSRIGVFVDVPSEVTARALAEIRRELARLVAEPVPGPELEQARQYAVGTLKSGFAGNAGLADTLLTVVADGLGLDWLPRHVEALAGTTAEEVRAAAARYLDPASAVTVVLGDAGVIEPELSSLGPVSRTSRS